MRRLLIIFTLLCIANTVCAQKTYYYKEVKEIRSDGSMIKKNGTLYFTFTGDIMYQSNADGTKKDLRTGISFSSSPVYAPTFYYRGEINDCWWYCPYQYSSTGYGMYSRMVELRNKSYYLVSKDYNTINYVFGGSTTVYQRCTPEDDVPGLIR